MIKVWKTGGGPKQEYRKLSIGAYDNAGKENLGVTVSLGQCKRSDAEVSILLPYDRIVPIDLIPTLIDVLEYVSHYEEKTRKRWHQPVKEADVEYLPVNVAVEKHEDKKYPKATFWSISSKTRVYGINAPGDFYEKQIAVVLEYFAGRRVDAYITEDFLRPVDLPHLLACLRAAHLFYREMGFVNCIRDPFDQSGTVGERLKTL
jgi:hypothetical protein